MCIFVKYLMCYISNLYFCFFPVEANDESFACKNCGKMYSNPASLIGHLKYKCNTGRTVSIMSYFYFIFECWNQAENLDQLGMNVW